MIAERCINPETMRAYPASMIEKALQDVHFVVSPSRPAKAQVIKAINQLQVNFAKYLHFKDHCTY